MTVEIKMNDLPQKPQHDVKVFYPVLLISKL